MKSSVLNAVLASVALTAPVFGGQDTKCEDCAPKYKNRLSVSPNSISYERTAEDSMFVSFEHSISPAFREKNIDVDVNTTSIKLGQTFAFDGKSRLTPSVGVSMFRDESYGTVYSTIDTEDGQVSSEITVQNPFLFHGTLGLAAEYEFLKSATFGLNVHGMLGSAWGSEVKKMGDMSWGFHTSLPVTFRFGTDAHWDVRMEPFAYLLKDYANYVGGKAALGYRF
jgi:hypothetical protein